MAAAKPKRAARKPPARGAGDDAALRARIVEAALDVAEDWGWYDIRLHHVAERLNLPLAAIRAEFRDGDAIADAWIARADAAMLAEPARGFARRVEEIDIHVCGAQRGIDDAVPQAICVPARRNRGQKDRDDEPRAHREIHA